MTKQHYRWTETRSYYQDFEILSKDMGVTREVVKDVTDNTASYRRVMGKMSAAQDHTHILNFFPIDSKGDAIPWTCECGGWDPHYQYSDCRSAQRAFTPRHGADCECSVCKDSYGT